MSRVSEDELDAVRTAVLRNLINIREKAAIIEIIQELKERRARDVSREEFEAWLDSHPDKSKDLTGGKDDK